MESVSLSPLRQTFNGFSMASLGMPFIILLIMSMLIVPLPTLLLDLLFTVNILTGLIIIMVSVHVSRPLEFSSFPSILLLATMLRLSLNVASTRVVLVNGHQGPEAAGDVIAAFGEFVIGGDYVVGFIIFMILMIINFIVVTKGAGRVSEVIARFTLDALPGKQMAIDADLNAGVIDQASAKLRREELSQESDFFGSMDGASKFVRGFLPLALLPVALPIAHQASERRDRRSPLRRNLRLLLRKESSAVNPELAKLHLQCRRGHRIGCRCANVGAHSAGAEELLRARGS